MAQISRPFQIALLAVGLLAAVWVVALRGHNSSSSSEISAPAAKQAAPAAAPSASASAPSAPGVAGLSRAVAKARGAVATSEKNAKQLEQKSAQASAQTSGGVAASTPRAAKPSSAAAVVPAAKAHAQAPAHAKAQVHTKAVAPTHATTTHKVASAAPSKTVPPAKHVPVKAAAPSIQHTVESQLKSGEVVVLLFWSAKGSDDVVVHRELQKLRSEHKVAVHSLSAKQVASLGSITRGVQVNSTPTLLIINKDGKTITLTGLQDSFAIAQAIDEARHA